MEEMIARWIRETRIEYEKAKNNVNAFKMNQMLELLEGLKQMRVKLLNPHK